MFVILPLIMAFNTVVHAEVFKCVVKGKVTFSGTRCAGATQKITIRTSVPSRPVVTRDNLNHESTIKYVAEGELRRKITDLKIGNERLERNINSYQRSMDSEMSALRNKKSFATNTGAGALWEQSISQEMSAITKKYGAKIDNAHSAISRNDRALDRLEEKYLKLKNTPIKIETPSSVVKNSNHEKTQQYIADGENRRRIKDLQRENDKLEGNIARYQRSMEEEMAALRQKKNLSANNSAGALWEQSISEEMNSVAKKYDTKIDSANSNISRNDRALERLDKY